MITWTPIARLDEVTPDYPQQSDTWYMVRHLPDPTSTDPAIRRGSIYPVPGYLLGSKRQGQWEYCPIADFWAQQDGVARAAPVAQDGNDWKKRASDLKTSREQLRDTVRGAITTLQDAVEWS